jgi:hypothetical protein
VLRRGEWKWSVLRIGISTLDKHTCWFLLLFLY